MAAIVYLLKSSMLCGGVKVVLRQAEALANRGHRVSVICADPYPDWFDGRVDYRQMDPYDAAHLRFFEWIIATFPDFLLRVTRHLAPSQKMIHLIQGYEMDIREAKPFQQLLDTAYALSVPRITVSPAMAKLLSRRYPSQKFYSVGQGLERNLFFPSDRPISDSMPESLILIGPLTISFKQIQKGLEAYRLIRQQYPEMRLIRISSIDTRMEEERLINCSIYSYLVHIPPKQVAAVLRTQNAVLLSPSSPEEGFGLPALEAMACGVPVVLTNIPSYRTFSSPCDYAEFADTSDPADMASAVSRILENPGLRKNRIQRGLEVAGQFSYDHVAKALEGVFDRVSS